MTPTTASPTTLRGGEWLLQPTSPADVFTPARLTDEQRLIAQTVTDFVTNDVLPVLDRLEQKDWALARDLVKRCGALGLLGVDVAEAYGGVELDKVVVDDRQRADVAGGVVRRHVRRAREPAGAAALAVRHRGSEAPVSAAAADRRNRRRVLPERAGLRLRRARREDARRPPGRTAASS